MALDILRRSAVAQAFFTRVMAENGYTTFTTYFGDFTIADVYGESAIRDTYKRAVESWGKDIKWMTEICLVLNHKMWSFSENGVYNNPLGQVYESLWRECQDYILTYRRFNQDEIEYYYQTTD